MSVKKMMEAYTKTDHANVVEGNDPVAIISLLFDELIRAMQDFIQHSDPEKAKKMSAHGSLAVHLLLSMPCKPI